MVRTSPMPRLAAVNAATTAALRSAGGSVPVAGLCSGGLPAPWSVAPRDAVRSFTGQAYRPAWQTPGTRRACRTGVGEVRVRHSAAGAHRDVRVCSRDVPGNILALPGLVVPPDA